jgi:hypothetical protein
MEPRSAPGGREAEVVVSAPDGAELAVNETHQPHEKGALRRTLGLGLSQVEPAQAR